MMDGRNDRQPKSYKAPTLKGLDLSMKNKSLDKGESVFSFFFFLTKSIY